MARVVLTRRVLAPTAVVVSAAKVEDGGVLVGGGTWRMTEAYVLIQSRIGRSAEVAGALSTIAGVRFADVVIGPYDIIAGAEARNIDGLGRLIVARVQAVDGVARTVTCPVVHI